jgi:exodeoxyribonuclease V alpha subunit
VAAKLKAVDRYQILCALREGSTGVNAINRQVESCLLRHGLIDSQQRYYHGRPIMISQNDHNLQLYNGDSGVILADEAGVLQACFEGADGAVRRFAPGRLPPHDCAYAISVHKSQGSEYQHVALVLPPATATDLTPLVSRELIYTGITRARQRLTLACTEQVLYAGLRRRVCRSSGLPRQLQAFARQQVGTARP